MIDLQLALKLVHVLGAAVLFGTGMGIAFFMWMAHLTGDAAHVARTARVVVIADTVFTATAAILQPVSGLALVHVVGYSLFDSWIVLSLALYVLVGACWLKRQPAPPRCRSFPIRFRVSPTYWMSRTPG